MKRWATRLSIRLSAGRRVQEFLEARVTFAQRLMGIGSGTGVFVSGEGAVLELLAGSSPGPYRVFDVGSNKGQYLSLVLGALPRAGLEVHCFEPGRSTYEMLESGLAGVDTEGITLNNVALGAAQGELTLHYDRPGSGMASFTKRRLDHFNIPFDDSETVSVDTVDDYCARKGIDRIDLLKCDVEGHELDVFKGADRMFRSDGIGMVTFEFGGCNIDTRTFFQDYFYFFREVGMRMFRITPSGYLRPIDTYREIDEQFRTTNFVAVRER